MSARKVVIVTDSIAQVPAKVAQELDIRIVPFSVAVNDEILVDLTDADLGRLYQRMRTEKDLRLSTSAPSAGQYVQIFQEAFRTGAEALVYLGMASRLSRAFSSAVEAVRLMREEGSALPVSLYDTCIATPAQGFLAIAAARLAEAGASAAEIMTAVRSERERVGLAAGLETLEYLARGGRIGKVAYMLGNAIHILPVITVDTNGEVQPIARVVGFKHILAECLDYVREKTAGAARIRLAVIHADVLPYAEDLRARAVDALHPEEIFLIPFTPTMVAHTGPGIIGLAYHWSA